MSERSCKPGAEEERPQPANLLALVTYAALGDVIFLFVAFLQIVLSYTALQADRASVARRCPGRRSLGLWVFLPGAGQGSP
jgi:hypothetical protein